MSPRRPILKPLPSPTMTSTNPLPFAASHVPALDSPHVHFPPTPTLTQTEVTHSAFTYDRKSIVVLPNDCALPERGERTLEAAGAESWSPTSCPRLEKVGYFHPRPYEAVWCDAQSGLQLRASSSLLFEHDASVALVPSQPYPYPYPHHLRQSRGQHDNQSRLNSHSRPTPPPLIFDSSESSDSSDLGSPPEIPQAYSAPVHPYHFATHISNMDLSLPFLATKDTSPMKKRAFTGDRNGDERDVSLTPKTKTKSRTRTSSTSSLERTRKVVSAGAATACGGFSASFCDAPLDGCLGGF